MKLSDDSARYLNEAQKMDPSPDWHIHVISDYLIVLNGKPNVGYRYNDGPTVSIHYSAIRDEITYTVTLDSTKELEASSSLISIKDAWEQAKHLERQKLLDSMPKCMCKKTMGQSCPHS